MSLGENLKALRKEKGVTQQEIASVLGIKQNTYSQYENDKRDPDLHTITLLSRYFNVPVDTILFGLDEQPTIIDEDLTFHILRFVEILKDEEQFKGFNYSELTKAAKESLVDLIEEKLSKINTKD